MVKIPKYFYVYIITNNVLNKQYVGSRMCYKDNINNDIYWGSSKYLNEDYKIYGKENFKKEILKNNYNNKLDMLNGETEFILKYNTLEPSGYNRFLPNKKQGFHRYGIKMSDINKKLVSERHKGKIVSEESRKKNE